MAPTDHHCNDDKLANDCKLGAERGIDVGDPYTQAHCTVRADHLEQARKKIEAPFVDFLALADSNDEKSK